MQVDDGALRESDREPRDDPSAALDAAERAGYRLMLLGRTAVLALAFAWSLFGAALNGNVFGPLVVAGSLLIGLAEFATLGGRHERRWRRFAIVGLDVGMVAAAAIHAPLLAGEAVPQHFVFRAYSLHLLWFAPVVSALTLSPALTAFAGAAAAAAVWAIYLGVTHGMERILSWSDLARGADAAAYIALMLDPDFIARGNRIEESAALLAGGLLLAVAVRRARSVVTAHAIEAARRRRVERVFGRHVPSAVAQRLIDSPGALAPTVQDATALHLDAEGFTAFAAGRPPVEVLETLDALLARAAAVVADRGGVVVSFGGDSMLAVFGAPLPLPDHAERALDAARAILAALTDAPLKVRIGLASGPVAAGVVGGRARQAFTIYGDVVNRAQRLEQACKTAGVRLLVSTETADRVGEDHDLIQVDVGALKGLDGVVTAHAG